MALAQRHQVGPVESLGIVLVLEGLDVIDLLCWCVLLLLHAADTPRVMLQVEASQL